MKKVYSNEERAEALKLASEIGSYGRRASVRYNPKYDIELEEP